MCLSAPSRVVAARRGISDLRDGVAWCGAVCRGGVAGEGCDSTEFSIGFVLEGMDGVVGQQVRTPDGNLRAGRQGRRASRSYLVTLLVLMQMPTVTSRVSSREGTTCNQPSTS
jgi:hypothetical protein